MLRVVCISSIATREYDPYRSLATRSWGSTALRMRISRPVKATAPASSSILQVVVVVEVVVVAAAVVVVVVGSSSR